MQAGGARPVDQAERDRACSDLDTSYAVEAGAGTGKTSLLIDRIMSIVRSGRAELDQVVAITFTEKAAGEMKVRLRDRIDSDLSTLRTPSPPSDGSTLCAASDGAADGPPGRAELVRRLERARQRLDRASITTIHSFAAGLIRERPVEAGVDPGFVVLDEIGSGLLLDEAWEEWIARELAVKPGEAANGPRAALSLALACGITLDSIRDLALRLYAERDLTTIGASGDASPLDREADRHQADGRWACVDVDALAAPWVHVREGLDKLESLLASGGCDESDPAFQAVASVRERLRTLERIGAGAEDRAAALACEALALRRGTGRNVVPGRASAWADPSRMEEFRQAYADLQELLSHHASRARSAVAEGLGAWICGPGGFLEFVELAKRQRAVLDFQDLLIKARDMLRDSEEARRYFQRRFSYILVDEFQDTDPLQVELVLLLNDGAPGKLFIVGDPKQSIYRFRRADIEVYEQARTELLKTPATPTARAGGAAELTIRVNFRSLPGILNWVNRAFQSAMGADPELEGGSPTAAPGQACIQARYVPLVPHRTDVGPAPWPGPAAIEAGGPGECQRVISQRVIGLDVPGVAEAGEARRAEAEAIASWVAAARGLPLCTDDRGMPRPLGYSDVAVLFPGMTGMDVYEDAFTKLSVPYKLEGGKLFYARREVRALVNVLRVLADPGDAVACVGALRSPAFGISDEELARHVLSGGTLDYREPLPAGASAACSGGGDPGIAEAFAVLRELHEGRNHRPLARTVELALERTGLVRLLLLSPRGRQAVANLYKIVDMARSMDHSGLAVSFSGFVRYLCGLTAQRIAEAESPMAEHDEEAVTLLTVHKAKGLEFPVVILANLVSGGRGSDAVVVDRARRTVSFRVGPSEQGFATRGFEDAQAREAARSRAEDVRLLYVAATRARDLLVIPKSGTSATPDKVRRGSRYMPHIAEHVLALPGPEALFGAHPTLAAAGLSPRAAAPPRERGGLSRVELEVKREALARSLVVPVTAGPAPGAARPEPTGGWAVAGVEGVEAVEAVEGIAAIGAEVAAASQATGEPAARAVAIGTALHAAMERMDLVAALRAVADGDMSPLRLVCTAAAVENGVADAAEEVVSLAAGCLRSRALARAARAIAEGRAVYREVPFTYLVDSKSADGSGVARGRMDLVFEEPDGLVIVDYKTDRGSDAEFEARVEGVYGAQGESYAHAAQLLTGKPVKEIVFVRANSATEVAFRPVQLRSGRPGSA